MTYISEFDPSNIALVEFSDQVVMVCVVVSYICNCYGLVIVYFYNTSNVAMLTLLNKMYEKKTKSDATKDVFIAAMSQEFRNPLNSMI
jgi:hypothetical protein